MAKPDWITTDKASGTGKSTVNVTAAINPSTSSSRNGTITIKTASGLTKTVSVSQAKRTPIPVIVCGENGYIEKLEI